jgi:hypothetical protein
MGLSCCGASPGGPARGRRATEQQLQEEASAAHRVHRELAAARQALAQALEEGQRASHYAQGLLAKLEESERSRRYYRDLAEHRLGETLWLRGEMSSSWRGRVQKEMALAVERTGDACALPAGLFPNLAAEMQRVAPEAMQRRATRLAGGGRGLDALHPDVDMYGSTGSHGAGPPDFKPTLARLAAAAAAPGPPAV